VAKDLIERIEQAGTIDDALKEEIFRVNRLDLLCDKHELEWPVKGWKLNLVNLFKLVYSWR
jgi:hypothetical protein